MDMEMELTGDATAPAAEHAAPAKSAGPAAHGQQHPIWLYLVVWTALFILSACSYLVDYFDFHGLVRWFLIVLFMMMKASLIVAVFMHMAWERLALVVAILLPPLAVLVLMAMMAVEANYTNLSRLIFFGAGQ
jgi:cytochrome c oxidase subunit IV